MFKKISLLTTIVAFATAAYADIALDLHVILTQGESVREINKNVIVAENSSVELYRCEGGQLVGYVDNVTAEGAQLNLQVNKCDGEECTLLYSPVLTLAWNEKATVSFGEENAGLVVEKLTVEVTAQQVPAAQ